MSNPDPYAPVVTALSIYRSLRKAPMTLREIADAHGVSRDKARRLLDALVSADVPIAEGRRQAERGAPATTYRAGRI